MLVNVEASARDRAAGWVSPRAFQEPSLHRVSLEGREHYDERADKRMLAGALDVCEGIAGDVVDEGERR